MTRKYIKKFYFRLSILENILLKTMFELPDMENVIKVTIDSASVTGKSEPIVTYGKKASTSVA